MTGPDATGAGPGSPEPERVPPRGVRTSGATPERPARVVLVRHGEAACNTDGVVGGTRGCTGLTRRGFAQVGALADRLARTGELAGVAALYSSVLPRAVQTARGIAPALDRWREGPPLAPQQDCQLCELHPGEADGLTWAEFSARFEAPDWDTDPDRPLAPGAESWRGFTARAAAGVNALADAHPDQLVVAACHAGVIEATLLHFLPVGQTRLGLRTEHASMTEWERQGDRWLLRRYNDVTLLDSAALD